MPRVLVMLGLLGAVAASWSEEVKAPLPQGLDAAAELLWNQVRSDLYGAWQ